MARRTYTATVVSDKMDKTVVVAITRLFQHRQFRKTVKRVTKFKAHDSENACKVGDLVSIEETKPLSKDKRWRIVEILERA